MAGVAGVVVYFGTTAPPPPPWSDAHATPTPQAGQACDAGGGVWYPVNSKGFLLPLSGAPLQLPLLHADDVASGELEVYLLVQNFFGLAFHPTLVALSSLDQKAEDTPVRVGACTEGNDSYWRIKAGPSGVKTQDGKETKAIVWIEPGDFSIEPLVCGTTTPVPDNRPAECSPHGPTPADGTRDLVFLDFAALEEQP
jgi:hypothetical protein